MCESASLLRYAYIACLVLFFFVCFRKRVSSCKSLQGTQNIRYKHLQGLFGTFLDWVMHIEGEGKYFLATEWR